MTQNNMQQKNENYQINFEENKKQESLLIQITKYIENGDFNEIQKIIKKSQDNEIPINIDKIFAHFFIQYLNKQKNQIQTIEKLKSISEAVKETKINIDLKSLYITTLIHSIEITSIGVAIGIINLAKEYNLEDILNTNQIKKTCIFTLSRNLENNQTNKARELLNMIIRYNILSKKEIQKSFYTGLSQALANNNLNKIGEVLNITKLNDLNLSDLFLSEEFKSAHENNKFLENFKIIKEKENINTLQGLIDYIKNPDIKNKLKKHFDDKDNWQ